MIYSIKNFFHMLFHFVWSLFISGLLTILPLTLTVAIFTFSFRLMLGWLSPLATFKPHFLDRIPHSEIILIVAIIFLIGTILKVFLLRSIIHVVEEVIARIPIVRPIYGGIKQLVQAFGTQDKVSFKQVVLVEFPRKGIYSLGFLTSELPQELRPDQSIPFWNIFIPTTPNPTTGYFIMAPSHEVISVDLTRQEAMALIISGGIILPDKFKQQQSL